MGEARGIAIGEAHTELTFERGNVLLELEGMDGDLAAKLAENSIRTRDDLAELAVDELTEMTGIEDERARTLIMAARAHWFVESEQ